MKQLNGKQAQAVLRLLLTLENLEDPNGMLPIPEGPEVEELYDAREEVEAEGVKDALR